MIVMRVLTVASGEALAAVAVMAPLAFWRGEPSRLSCQQQ